HSLQNASKSAGCLQPTLHSLDLLRFNIRFFDERRAHVIAEEFCRLAEPFGRIYRAVNARVDREGRQENSSGHFDRSRKGAFDNLNRYFDRLLIKLQCTYSRELIGRTSKPRKLLFRNVVRP